MLIQMELWHLIVLLLAFFSAVGTFGKVLLAQFEKRQAERFVAQDEQRKKTEEHWDQRFKAIDKDIGQFDRFEREFLEWKGRLPMTYVMREDYVRNQTVIEAKLDSVMLRIENLQLKGVTK